MNAKAANGGDNATAIAVAELGNLPNKKGHQKVALCLYSETSSIRSLTGGTPRYSLFPSSSKAGTP